MWDCPIPLVMTASSSQGTTEASWKKTGISECKSQFPPLLLAGSARGRVCDSVDVLTRLAQGGGKHTFMERSTWLLCQFLTMVLSPDDIAAISQIVATTIHGLQAGRDGGGGNREKCHVDEKFFRKIPTFPGENSRDWSFQVKAAAKSSSKEAGKLLDWAEEQLDEILDYSAFLEDADQAEQMSGELFQILTQLAAGEPLQVLHKQLLLGILNPEKPKSNKEIPNMIDRWEHRVMVLERDFKESISSRMRSAILISTVPPDIRDSLLQSADKYEEYLPTKERIIAVVEAKLAMEAATGRVPMDCGRVGGPGDDGGINAAGGGRDKGPCYRCGEHGHIARDCSKGVKGGMGKRFRGACWLCGKTGHPARECPMTWKGKGKGKEGEGDGREGPQTIVLLTLKRKILEKAESGRCQKGFQTHTSVRPSRALEGGEQRRRAGGQRQRSEPVDARMGAHSGPG